jgi:hypothetical protein
VDFPFPFNGVIIWTGGHANADGKTAKAVLVAGKKGRGGGGGEGGGWNPGIKTEALKAQCLLLCSAIASASSVTGSRSTLLSVSRSSSSSWRRVTDVKKKKTSVEWRRDCRTGRSPFSTWWPDGRVRSSSRRKVRYAGTPRVAAARRSRLVRLHLQPAGKVLERLFAGATDRRTLPRVYVQLLPRSCWPRDLPANKTRSKNSYVHITTYKEDTLSRTQGLHAGHSKVRAETEERLGQKG